MINKFEAVGIFLCIGVMSLALFLLKLDESAGLLSMVENNSQVATIAVSDDTTEGGLENTLRNSMSANGTVLKLVVDDIVEGEGKEAKSGDKISVNYIGTLQNGEQFDNSYTKGEPYTFTLGEGRVIKGWDEGIVGMKVGGQRILVVPPDMAYGNKIYGPIPANATLIFSVELVEIE